MPCHFLTFNSILRWCPSHPSLISLVYSLYIIPLPHIPLLLYIFTYTLYGIRDSGSGRILDIDWFIPSPFLAFHALTFIIHVFPSSSPSSMPPSSILQTFLFYFAYLCPLYILLSYFPFPLYAWHLTFWGLLPILCVAFHVAVNGLLLP